MQYYGKKTVSSLILFFIICYAVLLLLALIIYQGGKEAVDPMEQLKQVLSDNNQSEFSFTVTETGPDYAITFSGIVTGKIIYGTVDELNLRVFAKDKEYFVQGGELIPHWQHVDEAALDGLPAIIRNPLSLLSLLFDIEEAAVNTGPDRLIEGVSCNAYLLEIPVSDELLSALFSSSSGIGDTRLRAYVWLDKESNFLKKLVLAMELQMDDHKVHLNRSYLMNKEKGELPLDLPKQIEVHHTNFSAYFSIRARSDYNDRF